MSKKVDKSKSTADSRKQKAKKYFDRVVSKSKEASKQLKQNKQIIKNLKKKNEKLVKSVNRGKYINKYVIINHIDASSTVAYYVNRCSGDDLLTESDDNPTPEELIHGDVSDEPTCLFTANEVKKFINNACKKLSQARDSTPELIKWFRRRLYGSVIPANVALAKAQRDDRLF